MGTAAHLASNVPTHVEVSNGVKTMWFLVDTICQVGKMSVGLYPRHAITTANGIKAEGPVATADCCHMPTVTS